MFLIFILLLATVQGSLKHHIEKRMVLGERAKKEDWFFTAWLVKDHSVGYPRYCGGSLISDKWLITAAHCVENIVDKPWGLTVHMGSVQRLHMKHNKKFHYNVSKIYLHPTYVKDEIPNDDIALIELAHPVIIDRVNKIRPIRLALWIIKDTNREDFSCEAAGWGKEGTYFSLLELKDPKSKPSMYLKSIKVPLLPKQKCIDSFETINGGSLISNKTTFWDVMICGGSYDPKMGTACLHDSGSPLICKDKYGNTDLHGITIAIHGPEINERPCAPGKQIMIFIRIAHYAKWILDTINCT